MGFLDSFSSSQWVAILLGMPAILAVSAITILAILTDHRRRVRLAELESEARDDMLRRGLSADDIAKILAAQSHLAASPDSQPDRYRIEGPAACDVVAMHEDGEWYRSLLLAAQADRFLVHYVGHDVSENAWVDRSHIRFPASIAPEMAEFGPLPEGCFAREALVEWDDGWYPAYVVMHLDRYYVHFVEHEWSQNEWVDESRVRFVSQPRPTSAPLKPAANGLEV